MTLPPMQRGLVWLICSLLAALALAGCMSLGGPTVITLSEADLARLVDRAFPLQRRLLEVLDVQLSTPRLRLLPQRNRLAVDLALTSQDRLFGQSSQGLLRFDAALRYEPRDATLRLTQVRVQRAGFNSAPPAPTGTTPAGSTSATPAALAAAASDGMLDRLGNALAERVLEDLAIYTVPAERQASLRQLGLQPGAVTVTARGVEITLAPL